MPHKFAMLIEHRYHLTYTHRTKLTTENPRFYRNPKQT